MEKHREKILVLRYRFIGDTILAVPFFRNLRRAKPDAHIAWVVAPGSAEIVKGIPYVDELIYWDPATIHADCRNTHRKFSSKLTFIKDLRAKRFDKVYVLKRSLSSAIIAWLSGAPERVGFATEGRTFLLTTSVPYRYDQHEVLNFLDVLRTDDVPVTDDYLEAWTSPEEERQAEELLAAAGVPADARLLALHPLASSTGKSWPLENFAAVACRLRESFGLYPVVLGGEGDVMAFDQCRHLFPAGTIDFVGKCGLRVTMAVLKRCTHFIGNDSGVMHMAAAAGIPLIAILGSTSPQRFGPWSKDARVISSNFPCSPCKQKFFNECEPSARMRPPCLEAITVEQVVRESIEFISSLNNRASGGVVTPLTNSIPAD